MTDDGGGKRPGPPQEARNISDYKRVKSHNEEIEKGTNPKLLQIDC